MRTQPEGHRTTAQDDDRIVEVTFRGHQTDEPPEHEASTGMVSSCERLPKVDVGRRSQKSLASSQLRRSSRLTTLSPSPM